VKDKGQVIPAKAGISSAFVSSVQGLSEILLLKLTAGFSRFLLILTILWIANPQVLGEDIQLVPSSSAALEEFGTACSLDGDYALVSKLYTQAPSVYVFHDSGSGWSESQILLSGQTEGITEFGRSVDIKGDYLVVGENCGFGSCENIAYVYRIEGETWVEDQIITGSDISPGSSDKFGISVSISDSCIVVGGETAGIPKLYVFRFDGSGWVEEQILTAWNPVAESAFGEAVAVHGDYIIAGDYKDWTLGEEAGSLYVYHYNGTNWSGLQKLYASDGYADEQFGYSVDIQDDFFVAGAPWNNGRGAAYIFRNTGNYWLEAAILKGDSMGQGDRVGYHVSLDTGKFVMGAPGDDDMGLEAGAAYLFKYQATHWYRIEKLYALTPGVGDKFGNSVSVSGDNLLITAYQADSPGFNSGAAYMYERIINQMPSQSLTGLLLILFVIGFFIKKRTYG